MILKKDNVERVAESAAGIEKLIRDGFEAVGAEAAVTPGEKMGKPVTEMTAAELKSLAKERGIEGANSLTKEELLDVLKDVSAGG